MDEPPLFVLRPSPWVMIAVVAIILALIGVGARHASRPPLGLLGGALALIALTAFAIAQRRRR